jgi:hypothetical protein
MIGIKAGLGTLDGTKTVDPSHGVATNTTGSVDSEYGAIFAEFSLNDRFSFGLEVVPMSGIIDTKATTAADSQVTVEDLITAYALVPFGDTPAYGKIGYSKADLSVVANYTQTTVNSASDSLEGPMIGIGAQFDSPIPFLDVMRLEVTHHRFDEIKITTTDTNEAAQTKKGDAELTTLSLSIAKSF